ncbi:transketolase [Alicyclobacillus kakegawensis]|uniref:transketolase n=1 Tax=Alicyclobacillus kakegawensis TaxID=392012 RepID=UPI00082B8AD6|nr:transketolase [Alicyclobacillus kakegawensis]
MTKAVTDVEHIEELRELARTARQHIVRTIHKAGAGHLGGPLSAVDILTALYFDVMNVNPDNPSWEDRDRFVLSKGHSAIALYTVLAMRGFFPVAELDTFDAMDSRLQGHPDMKLLPGVDMSTGSLGQGISAAVGMALGAKLQGRKFRVFCLIGDGESQEGQVWEAADIAAKYGLDNLVVIMDFNKLQQFGWGKGSLRASPVANPKERWAAFGWNVGVVNDGNDIAELLAALHTPAAPGRPSIWIAHTVKGKGVRFMENDYVWHAKVPSLQELNDALVELGGTPCI